MTTANNYLLEAGCTGRPSLRSYSAAALATHTAAAQTPPAPDNDQTDTPAPIEEVVVTGSRIATPSLASVQ